jgi:hypothetical protein
MLPRDIAVSGDGLSIWGLEWLMTLTGQNERCERGTMSAAEGAWREFKSRSKDSFDQ